MLNGFEKFGENNWKKVCLYMSGNLKDWRKYIKIYFEFEIRLFFDFADFCFILKKIKLKIMKDVMWV